MKKHRKKRKHLFRKLVFLSLCALILFSFLRLSKMLPAPYSAASFGDSSGIQVNLNNLNSPYAIAADLSTGEIVGEQNSSGKLYPASLTKIMTAVVALEHIPDMNQSITLSADFFPALYAQDASMAGFQPGETATARDLLYGVLLPSGAECCMAFAYETAGSESDFVSLMNEKAAELGMANTHFQNSTGLHDPEHYSTAADLLKLLEYALKNQEFRSAFTCSRYSIPPTTEHPDGFTFTSTLFKYMDSPAMEGGEILGGKTGYTQEAGLCLASLASVNGREYIAVTAGAKGNHETEQYHIIDAKNIYKQIKES